MANSLYVLRSSCSSQAFEMAWWSLSTLDTCKNSVEADTRKWSRWPPDLCSLSSMKRSALSLEGVQLHSQALHARTPEPGDQPHQAWELLHGLSDALQSFHCALHGTLPHCPLLHPHSKQALE